MDGEIGRIRFALGMLGVVDRSLPQGLDLTAAVLAAQGFHARTVQAWMRRQQERALSATPDLPTAPSAA